MLIVSLLAVNDLALLFFLGFEKGGLFSKLPSQSSLNFCIESLISLMSTLIGMMGASSSTSYCMTLVNVD